MDYLCIGLIILAVLLALRLFFLNRIIEKAGRQMDEIEESPQSNRQLKTSMVNRRVEELMNKINRIYQARQKERILYQRRETEIRQEIENISHDLRTPLTSIIGYLELLQDPETEEAEKKEYLGIISKRARVLQSFIKDFYEISRMEGEDYPILLDRLQVQNMVSDSAVAYYHEFETRKIQVSIDLEEKPCYIIADKIQFNRILNNLIQNALKYSRKQFEIRQYVKNRKCILQFRNDKEVMKEEELKLIFDRFYTGDQTRNSGSTGLGLTITRILVEKMKGSVSARFEEDMFVIELLWDESVL